MGDSASDSAGSPPVRCEEVDGIAVLTLDRPEEGNALTADTLAQLRRTTTRLRDEERVRGVVLTGSGAAFCVGADVGELRRFSRSRAVDELTTMAEDLAAVVLALRALPGPVVAAVNGLAAGAGFSLALACDVRVAAERAAFHFAYGALGATTDGGMSWLLPRLVGADRALTLLLEQPVLRSATAQRLGLLAEVVPADVLVDTALRLARSLSGYPAHTVRAVKELIGSSFAASLEDHLRREHDLAVRTLLDPDVLGGPADRRPAPGAG